MKKIMWAVSLISLIGTMIVLRFMPESVPMHYDLAGNIDRWGSKYESLIFPAIILCMSLVMTLLIRYFEKKALNAPDEKERAGALTNARVTGITGLSMAAMFTIMQGFILYGSYHEAVSGSSKQTVDIGKISVILMGILFIVLGNFMTKTRNNRAVGFRISWSMYNDQTWRKSNRFGAFALMIAGALTVAAGVLTDQFMIAMTAALGVVMLAVLVTAIYAHRVYRQEIEAEKGEM